MQIERNGSGPWPVAEVDGVQVTLSVGEDSRVFDCAALQGDGQVTVDVVRGIGGKLTEGVENGTEYVANLIIPPARYEDVPLPVTLAEVEVPDDLDPMCISSVPTTQIERVPLGEEDMAAVRLILWTVQEPQTED